MACFDLDLSISRQLSSWLDNDVFCTRMLYFSAGWNKAKGFQHWPERVCAFDRSCAHLSDSTDSPVRNAAWSHITTSVTPSLSGASDQGRVGQKSREVVENRSERVIFGPSDSSAWVWNRWWSSLFLNPLRALSKAAEMACSYHGDSAVETCQYGFNTLNCNTRLPDLIMSTTLEVLHAAGAEGHPIVGPAAYQLLLWSAAIQLWEAYKLFTSCLHSSRTRMHLSSLIWKICCILQALFFHALAHLELLF